MGPWKSPFELVIPYKTPSQIATTAREHGGSRGRVGLIMRVRDDRIRVRYNELSRTSTAPLLKGHLISDGVDTRITGVIQWTNVIAAPIAALIVALTALVGGLALIIQGDRLAGALFLLLSSGFLYLTVSAFRGEDSDRRCEEQRLRKELVECLDGRRNH